MSPLPGPWSGPTLGVLTDRPPTPPPLSPVGVRTNESPSKTRLSPVQLEERGVGRLRRFPRFPPPHFGRPQGVQFDVPHGSESQGPLSPPPRDPTPYSTGRTTLPCPCPIGPNGTRTREMDPEKKG